MHSCRTIYIYVRRNVMKHPSRRPLDFRGFFGFWFHFGTFCREERFFFERLIQPKHFKFLSLRLRSRIKFLKKKKVEVSEILSNL